MLNCWNILWYLWFVLQFLVNGILGTLIGFLVLACIIGLVVSLFGVYALSVSAIKVRSSALLLKIMMFCSRYLPVLMFLRLIYETDCQIDCFLLGNDTHPSLYCKPTLWCWRSGPECDPCWKLTK